MKALAYLVETTLTIILCVFLLRAILQMIRANFRNPITQAITRFTNPVIMPLRKIIPPIGKIDSASVISVLFVACVITTINLLFQGQPLNVITQYPLDFLAATIKKITLILLQLYWFLIFFGILISWMQPHQHSPLSSILDELTEPLLRPARRLIKPIGGMDLSPIPVLIILTALQYQFS